MKHISTFKPLVDVYKLCTKVGRDGKFHGSYRKGDICGFCVGDRIGIKTLVLSSNSGALRLDNMHT